MTWKDLLQKPDEAIVLPWLGGRVLRSGPRSWTIDGKLPQEHGWNTFRLSGRNATFALGWPAEAPPFSEKVCGYLVGDRVVPDGVPVDPNPAHIIQHSERVHLLEPGLDRFVRVSAGRMYEGGPLVYERQEMPLGPEDAVLQAYLDKLSSVDHVPGVPPALDAAFRMECWHREETERRRAELERLRREEETRRALEERRRQLVEKLGDGVSRREMAQVDFAEAARAALAVGGAEYLDHRTSVRRNEMTVRFRLRGRRYECVCDKSTLQIIDSGICLTAHYDDPDFEGGTKGDTFFSLESLPSVLLEAENRGRLVVYRHVD